MLVALKGFEGIPGRYFLSARNNYLMYAIAEKFGLSPAEVKRWPADEILEALAYIKLTTPKGKGVTS